MNPRLLKLLSVTALVTACLLHPTPARAQYVTVGGLFSGRPSCAPTVQSPNNPYNCVARAANNVLYGVHYDFHLGLSGPSNLVVTTVRNPSCARERFNGVTVGSERSTICAVVGVDNALYGFATAFASVLLTPFRNLGGTIAGDPSCVLTEDGNGLANGFATCAAVDANNRLVAVRFNPSTGETSGWQVLGGTVVDNPSCVAAKGGLQQVICAVKGTNNGLFGIRFGPQTGYTSGFKSLGGKFVGSPSCANTGSGTATCAIRDANNALVGIRFNPNTGGKTPFQNLGGTWVGDPSCAPNNQGFNRVVCVGRATENQLEWIRFDPSTSFNSGFQGIPGQFASDAGCAHGDNPVDYDVGVFCAARDMNNGLTVFYIAP